MKKILLGLFIFLLFAAGALFFLNGTDTYKNTQRSATLSDGINIGSTITYTLADQFENMHTLEGSTQTLILVFAKDTGHIVKEYLGAQNAGYLAHHKAAFVADISPMPIVIRNTFALPDLKTQPYSVNLILDEKIAKAFKNGAKTDAITIVTLSNKRVKKVIFVKDATALKTAIEKN